MLPMGMSDAELAALGTDREEAGAALADIAAWQADRRVGYAALAERAMADLAAWRRRLAEVNERTHLRLADDAERARALAAGAADDGEYGRRLAAAMVPPTAAGCAAVGRDFGAVARAYVLALRAGAAR